MGNGDDDLVSTGTNLQPTDRAPAATIPPFIKESAERVREHLATALTIPTLLQGVGTLTLDERRLLVDQALVLFEQNYVHLPLKTAMYTVNPVQSLRVLRRRLERQTPQTMPQEWIFHAELSEIFHSVRDLHTNYLLPYPFTGKIAFLPFQIEECTGGRGSQYLVTHVIPGFSAPGFEPGVVVTHWNGIPIATAVDLNAALYAASNTAARHSRGVQSLTVRPLKIHLPPFEEWVTVSYIDADGSWRELRESWQIVDNLPASVDADAVSTTALCQGIDLEADETSRAKVLLFAPRVVAQEQAVQADEPAPWLREGEVATTMPKVFKAQGVATPRVPSATSGSSPSTSMTRRRSSRNSCGSSASSRRTGSSWTSATTAAATSTPPSSPYRS